MNNITMVGRLTRDPEIRQAGNTDVCRFAIAVDRGKDKDGQKIADFIDWVAFGRTAQLINQFFHKGDGIGIVGHIQNDNYTDKDGKKVYRNTQIVDRISFLPSSRTGSGVASETPAAGNAAGEDFMAVPDGDDGLPFN